MRLIAVTLYLCARVLVSVFVCVLRVQRAAAFA